MLSANLAVALSKAIAVEEKAGNGRSAQVAGWKTVLEDLKAGRRVEIINSEDVL